VDNGKNNNNITPLREGLNDKNLIEKYKILNRIFLIRIQLKIMKFVHQKYMPIYFLVTRVKKS